MRLLITSSIVLAGLLSLPAFAATFDGYAVDESGSASVLNNGDLQLTSTYHQAGAAWLNAPISTTTSFTVNYGFSLARIAGSRIADGITFAMQGSGNTALGSAGSGIGFSGLNGVGSVIQTYTNAHVGLSTDGNPGNTPYAPADIGSAQLLTGSETISYNANTDTLSMTGVLDKDNTIYNISGNASVNLNQKFGPTMYVGFTGGTGIDESDQRITSFSITPPPPVPEPGSNVLMFAGLVLAGVGGWAGRRSKKSSDDNVLSVA